jgi:hypothetical protein
MDFDPDAVADAVITQFEKLPNKRKPHVRSNGVYEWVPLSGIVARGCYRHIPSCNTEFRDYTDVGIQILGMDLWDVSLWREFSFHGREALHAPRSSASSLSEA